MKHQNLKRKAPVKLSGINDESCCKKPLRAPSTEVQKENSRLGKQVAQDEKLKESTGFFESCQEVLKQNSRNVEALSLECCLSTLPFGIL